MSIDSLNIQILQQATIGCVVFWSPSGKFVFFCSLKKKKIISVLVIAERNSNIPFTRQRCKTEQALCSKPANVYTCLLSFGSREACNEGEGDPPLYVNVNMYTGQLMNTWIDSLQAFFPGLQVK